MEFSVHHSKPESWQSADFGPPSFSGERVLETAPVDVARPVYHVDLDSGAKTGFDRAEELGALV